MKDQPNVQYTPKGLKIPIPTRGEFEANLEKVLKAEPPPRKVPSRRSKAAPTDS
jgi:hypothetical protein